jgi:outer membrane autotransporter protein
MRAYGRQLDIDLELGGVSEFTARQYGADVGYDHALATGDNSALYIGAFAGYQTSRLTFKHGYGKGDTESVLGGIYAAWLHKNGLFANATLKAQNFDNETRVRANGNSLIEEGSANYNTLAAGAAFEFGWRFTFGNGWFVEPALQVAYAYIDSEDYTINDGSAAADRLQVANGTADVLRGAAQLRAGKVFDLGSAGRLQPYLKIAAEVQESFGGKTTVTDPTLARNASASYAETYATRRWSPDTDGTRYTLGIGAAWQFNQSLQIHLDFETATGDKYDLPWSISAGYRLRF